MSNPFIAPAELATPPRAPDEVEVYRELVLAMRFPVLMLGAVGLLLSVVVMGIAGVLVLGAGRAKGPEAAVTMGVAVLYGAVGSLQLVPAALLFWSGLAGLLGRNDPERLVDSLRAQLWFWRVLALYVLGTTGLYMLGFAAFILVGVLT